MPGDRQSGIALITVLLILSLATVAAVAMTSRQQLDIRRTSNILQIEQAYMVLLAAEEFAKRGLIEDAKDNQTDAMNDLWNDQRLKIAVQEIGNFNVTNFSVEDLQGRFNINNLLDNSGKHVDANNHRNFTRLLTEAGLPASLADAAYDWVDPDINQYNSGAEDDAYSVLDKPYRTPNLLMGSASELFRLMGVNLSGKQDYDRSNLCRRETVCTMLLAQEQDCAIPACQNQQAQNQQQNQSGQNQTNPLQRLLVALPERTPINVNTVASPAIYMMMIKGLTQDDAQDMYNAIIQIKPSQDPGQKKKEDPKYTSTDQFWADSHIPKTMPKNERVDISVNSSYFLFRAQAIAKYNENFVVYLTTILHRDNDKGAPAVQVVRRSFSKSGEI